MRVSGKLSLSAASLVDTPGEGVDAGGLSSMPREFYIEEEMRSLSMAGVAILDHGLARLRWSTNHHSRP